MIKWTKEQEDLLRQYILIPHMTNRMIAAQLTNHFCDQFTTSMVRNKLERMRLKRPTPVAAKHAKVTVSEGTFESVRLLDARSGQCRWPVGEAVGADMMVCGCRTIIGSSYCAEHKERSREKNVFTR
jgi:hypothetical protein